METFKIMEKLSNKPAIIDIYSDIFIQLYSLDRGPSEDDDL